MPRKKKELPPEEVKFDKKDLGPFTRVTLNLSLSLTTRSKEKALAYAKAVLLDDILEQVTLYSIEELEDLFSYEKGYKKDVPDWLIEELKTEG